MSSECLLPMDKVKNRRKIHIESHRRVVLTHNSSHVVYYFSSVSLLLPPGSCPEWKLFRSTIQRHVVSISVATMARSTLTWWWMTLAWQSHAERRGSYSSCASSTPVWRRERRPPRDTSSSLVWPWVTVCMRFQKGLGMKFHQEYAVLSFILFYHHISFWSRK